MMTNARLKSRRLLLFQTRNWCAWIAFALLLPGSYAPADVVTYWNTVAGLTIRAERNYPGPNWAARSYAMVHAAMFDALNSIQPHFRPAHVQITNVPAGTLPEVAAAAAAHGVLAGVYPTQALMLADLLAEGIDAVPDGPAKQAALDLGREVARKIVEWRADDGTSRRVPYTLSRAPGIWQPTAPDFSPALGPGWGQVRPFVLTSGAQFRAPPPPALDSAEYTAAFNQVKQLGDRFSTNRTDDQTQIGIFWGYDRPGLGPPPILYNQMTQVIATQMGNNLMENARLFALINFAQADAGIASWETKYYYNLWRPIDGIRYATNGGNLATVAAPNWEPLGAPGGGIIPDFTPPFPAYSSGHSTFGAALCRMLAHFYGRDDIAFTLSSDELPGITRHYQTFSQADEENGISRIYLGIHWIFDKTSGQTTGYQVADYIFQHALIPLAPPVLRLTQAGSQIELTWQPSSQAMGVEYMAQFSNSAPWRPMTGYAAAIVNGRMKILMPVSGPAMFFRLSSPLAP